jgi:ketosteroid isomerase-like protein
MDSSDPTAVADGLRRAFDERDLAGLGALLAEDVRWGDDRHPNRCRGPADVVDRFAAQLAAGVDGGVVELWPGPAAVVAHLRWRAPGDDGAREVFQVYRVTAGRVSAIEAYGDAASARAAAGLGPAPGSRA